MGLVVNALTKFAKSGIGTSLYKFASEEKGQRLLATTLPLAETVVVTATRVATVERQDLSRREKNMIERQDVIPAVVGVTTGSFLNKKVFELGKDIGNKLDSSKVKDIDKIKSAIKVSLPIFTTCMLLRLVLPITAALVSSKIEDKKAEKKLDIKA